MKINFRIIFISLGCESITMDVTDRAGEEQVAVKLDKITWRGDLEVAKKEAVSGWFGSRTGYAFQSKLWQNLQKGARNRKAECMSCYESERTPGQCCNSCETLQKAFIDRGLNHERALTYPQCVSPIGCLVAGSVDVSRVAGNFHFAVGESHVEGSRHHHHWAEIYRKIGFNTTHYISHLSFGTEYPGIVNPLDGFSFTEQTLGQMQYFIQVVPTVYESESRLDTNQYSVTFQHSPIDLKSEHIELPGIFFKYDISPLMIQIREDNLPFTKFLARVLAMMGGIWVVIGLIYSMTSTTVKTVLKKLD